MNAAVQAVTAVQCTLDDFVEGVLKPIDDIICERLTQDKRIKSEPQIALFNNDHLGELHPFCPRCGSKKHVRNGFRKRRPKVGGFGKITVYVQRYKCRRCGKGFSARIDGIVKKWRQYAEIFKEKVNAIAAIMKYSGRAIQQVFLALFGVAPSHQTIENWLTADMPEFQYSGYYGYDEQVVRIKGKKAYRLTLFDSVLNVPVAEEITYKLSAKRVKRFLKKNLKGHLTYSITTDDRKWYREIIKALKAIHQLCGFHFIKRVTKDAEEYFKRKSISDAEKMRIAILVSAIREVFRSFTEREFLEKLEKVYLMKDTAPSRIKKHIETLVKDVDLYTNHLLNPLIPKTNNHVEEYYRQIDPKKMKKRYKTISGLTRALHLKGIYWIVRHGLISEEESLRIARQNLGKQYNKTNIYTVFSDKKKHVLTHWFHDPSKESEKNNL
jgi:transposase-like protein